LGSDQLRKHSDGAGPELKKIWQINNQCAGAGGHNPDHVVEENTSRTKHLFAAAEGFGITLI